MDANLMSCPSCGHTVSSSARACAYCGVTIASGDVKEQTAEEIAGEEALPTVSEYPAGVSESPVQPTEMPSAAGMSEETGKTMEASDKRSESIPVQHALVEPDAADSGEPEAKPEILPDASAAEATIEAEAATPDQPTSGRPEDSNNDAEIDSIEAEASEVVSIPEAETADDLVPQDDAPAAAENRAHSSGLPDLEGRVPAEDGPEESLLSPAPEVLELTADDTDELETLGADIVEMVENTAHEDHNQQLKAPDSTPFQEQAGDAASEKPADDVHPAEAPANNAEKTVELTSEALGETILLEAADEVQTPVKGKSAAAKPKDAAETGSDAAAIKSKLQQDPLKIEKAAGEMAAAIKKQKAELAEADKLKDPKTDPAKVQELKQQKAALAKQQAKKKQKLLLAKAAALKRKKAAEAKALALNKQNEAKAASKSPTQEQVASAGSMQKAARMQELLKKYEGQAIGINYDNSAEIREAMLENTNSEYFSVFVKDKQLHYSYPLKTILTVIEGKDGVETGSSKPPQKFNAVVKVYPLVLF